MVVNQTKLQDMFLEHLTQRQMALTVFLINGVKLQGIITSYDDQSLLLRRDGHAQLVYKHAISTIMPTQSFLLAECEAAGNAAE